ncbi:peptidoglycan/LPS O-acetylase OafA/YrhL [Rhizobium aethiopicum]|uniref:Peptidoglycan/LPS O-acetylase OafA/YrhL n=1 Tax=Rhizobium aethiopicum TaxID=1138170 RepID=A0A7W6QD12_9HYPH|nr:acyltransferase family protein [Rhizobium aethiopicum]MBB4195289.1 peptidoglycan/LPS O-acetylase OafA/YrhL [Rhizobium aethiopicum]MBB4584019.1 peptidoglycan/LPS O-acetylase OafA/YrhL [Rhizobium aethiopicum]
MIKGTSPNYRPEINGLRAIAVLPVVLFHGGIAPFHGGFAGVDVFFVISGYLITSIIYHDLVRGTFSFKRFYERRARRILPALFLVMVTSIPFAWLFLLPLDMKGFSESLIGVSLFVSNFVFWKQAGYFDAAAALKPLLHTWSLAVEEQFYIFFPPLLILLSRITRSITLALSMIAAISFVSAEFISRSDPTSAYYFLHTRAWELLIGAIVAIRSKEISRATDESPILGELIAGAGLLTILASVIFLWETTRYPSVYTLFPTVGAAMVLATGTGRTFVGKLLSLRPFVDIGLLSYSLYLWHQPVFAFARQYLDRSLSPSTAVALIVLCFALSALSWRYVEQPFRTGRVSARAVATSGAMSMSALIMLGYLGISSNGFASRLPTVVEWESLGQKVQQTGNVCALTPSDRTGVSYCFFGDVAAKRTVALYGDSHAQAISFSLAERFARMGLKGVLLRAPDCQPIPQTSTTKNETQLSQCLSAFQHLLDYVREDVDEIIVAIRWTFRLYPIPGQIDRLTFVNGEGGEEIEDYRENYAAVNGSFSVDGRSKTLAIDELIQSLERTGKRVVVVYPIPELGWNIAKVNLRHGPGLSELSTSEALYLERNKFVLGVLDNIAASETLRKVRPADVLCSKGGDGRCFGQRDGVPLYYDDDHLSARGADLVADEILKALN